MISFVEKVRTTVAAHSMLQAGDRVLAGVSGGSDSVALLLALKDLGYDVAVAHLNHGLRGEESDGDQQFVERLCAELGARCFSGNAQLAEAGNIENAGRAARKQFFQTVAQEHGFNKIALAHNRQDRVETFLLHLMRGAGNTGLVSMSPVAGKVVRPLIEHTKNEIEVFLSGRRQDWRIDATNADMSFTRNRMRHDLIPRLASFFNDRLVDTMARTLTVLQDEEQWMSTLAQEWLASNSGPAGLDVRALREAPTAMARRAIREGLRQSGSDLMDLTFEHVEAVRSLVGSGKSGKVIQLPGGFRAAREFDRLTFLKGEEDPAAFCYELRIPGKVRIPELKMEFHAWFVESAPAEVNAMAHGAQTAFVDGDRLGPCAKIRSWQPGDYYRPAGWPSGKVKKLFQRARVPRRQRHRTPVIATDSAIVWVVSFPVSREFLPDSRSKKIVAFDALPD